MSPFQLGLFGFVILLALMVLRAPIALALAAVGLGGVVYLRGWPNGEFLLGTVPYQVLSNYALSTLPLFILMGNVAGRAGLSDLLFDAINMVFGRLRGGMAIATIAASGAFSAAAGSSMAVTSTMARVAAPPMLQAGYSKRLVSASIASGGTLGIMIPPSTMFIIYAYLTETSIGRLFLAGLIPGIVLMLVFCGVVYAWSKFAPADAPRVDAGKMSWRRARGIFPRCFSSRSSWEGFLPEYSPLRRGRVSVPARRSLSPPSADACRSWTSLHR